MMTVITKFPFEIFALVVVTVALEPKIWTPFGQAWEQSDVIYYLAGKWPQSQIWNEFLLRHQPTDQIMFIDLHLRDKDKLVEFCELFQKKPPPLPANVSRCDGNDNVLECLAARHAAQPPYDPPLVVGLGNLNATFAVMARCLSLAEYGHGTSSFNWVLQSPDANKGKVKVLQMVNSTNLSLRLKLTENIYIVTGFVAYELYGVKGQPVLKPFIRSSMRRLHLSSSVVIDVAHVMPASGIARTGQETLRLTAGRADDLTYEVFAYMQDLLGFSARFHNVTVWVWTSGANHTELGMGDLVLDGSADIALSSTGLWTNLLYSFLYVTRVHKEIYVYYHTPESFGSRTGQRGNILAGIWGSDVLLSVLVTILLVFLLSRLIFGRKLTSQDRFIWCASIFTQQGVNLGFSEGTGIPARIYTLAVALGGLLFYTFSSGYLLVKFSSIPEIESVADLVTRGYTFGIEENGLLENAFFKFRYHTLGPLEPIHHQRSAYLTFKSEANGLRHVMDTTAFAYVAHHNSFLEHEDELESIGRNPNCGRVQQMILVGARRWGSAFVRSGSEFADHFNYARLHMAEVGLTGRILRVVLREEADTKPNCASTNSGSQIALNENGNGGRENHVGLTVSELMLLFSVLGIGAVCSLALLGLELLRKRTRLFGKPNSAMIELFTIP